MRRTGVADKKREAAILLHERWQRLRRAADLYQQGAMDQDAREQDIIEAAFKYVRMADAVTAGKAVR